MIGTDSEPPDEFDEPQDVEVMDSTSEPRGGESDALASSSSSLARRDPLGAYMRDVHRYPLLSKEEEHDLAVRFFEDDDLEAAKRLVTSNLRLVVKIAYDYRQAYKNILDLVQEGNIGLMQAVKKYDPYKGVKLSSYAAWWIRAYMLRYISEQPSLGQGGHNAGATETVLQSAERESQAIGDGHRADGGTHCGPPQRPRAGRRVDGHAACRRRRFTRCARRHR